MDFLTHILFWQNIGIVAGALLALVAIVRMISSQILKGISDKLDFVPASEFRESMGDITKRFDSLDDRLDWHLPNSGTPRLFMQVAEIKHDTAYNNDRLDKLEGLRSEAILSKLAAS